jgi:Ca2+-binding EF-hand superfamily protein
MNKIKEIQRATGTGLHNSGRIGSLITPPNEFRVSEFDLDPKVTIEFVEPGDYTIMMEGEQRRSATLRCGELIPYSIAEIEQYKATEFSTGRCVHIFRGTHKRGTNIREGPGSFHYGSGEVFEGRWKNNQRSGLGGLYLNSGYSYEGMFRDDVPNGRGVETLPSGEKYVGEFVDGKPHGRGTMYYVDNGSRYEGSWSKGEKHGRGVMFYDNGDVTAGTWVGGRRSGKLVTSEAATGKTYESTWVRDKFDRRTMVMVTSDQLLDPPVSEATPYKDLVSPLGIDLRHFRVVPDLWTEVHPAHFERIKLAFEALDKSCTGEIEMDYLRSIWDPNNMDTLSCMDKAATTVGDDNTLELIEVLTGLYPHLPASELRRWVQLDVPVETLLRLRGELAGVPSPKADGFLVLSEGKPALSQQHVEMNRGAVGGVRVHRGMFNRNAVLNRTDTMTFPQLLGQVYPSVWKEFLRRVEHSSIPLDALRGYERAFDQLDESGTGHLSLERMKAAQKRMQSALASGNCAQAPRIIPNPSNQYEAMVLRGPFKSQGRWLVADISVTVSFMKQIDRTRSGYVSFQELIRAAFPNVACHLSQERLNPAVKFEDVCRCCICEFCSTAKFMRPKPVSPYLDGSVVW